MNQVHGRDVAVVDGPFGDGRPARSTASSPCGRRPRPRRAHRRLHARSAGRSRRRGRGRRARRTARPGRRGRPRTRRGDGGARAPSRSGSSPVPDPPCAAAATRCPGEMRDEVAAVDADGVRHDELGHPGGRCRARECTPSSSGSGCHDREQSLVCTMESSDHFSYRRDQRHRSPRGLCLVGGELNRDGPHGPSVRTRRESRPGGGAHRGALARRRGASARR